uniref:Uncharacterized protein n=1 Tax=uncultured Thiotrichaceae bacterium TaxID=298394 RepID=A0A6S6U3Y6_9GAMM|nr:MAG: Unknown protein [uncultured Thiotrichaceae bacterium]
MKPNIQGIILVAATSFVVSACSHQQVADEPIAVVPAPVVQQPQPVVMPAPKPYVRPAPLRPAPLPVAKPVIVKPMPAPVRIAPKPVYVPPVKAKGNYRGAIPIASDLRQHYQQ